MLLSEQTPLGLRMTSQCINEVVENHNSMVVLLTALSFIDFVEYLLTHSEVRDIIVFLSNNLCQDTLEQFFGCQRQKG